MKKLSLALAVILVGVLINTSVMAQAVAVQNAEPSVAAKVADAAIVRPLCVLGASATTAVYIVVAIPTYIMGYADIMAEALVYGPWGYVNQRPLGEF